MSENMGEHAPIEMDPVADFENARAAMEELLQKAEAEKAEESDMRHRAEEQLKEAEQVVKNLQQENLQLHCAREQERKNVRKLVKLLKEERIAHEKDLREAAMKTVKSLKWPIIGLVAFGILAFLAGLCVDKGLMSYQLGEPVGYSCIAICAFFAGITWERCRR